MASKLLSLIKTKVSPVLTVETQNEELIGRLIRWNDIRHPHQSYWQSHRIQYSTFGQLIIK